jgi:phosphopantothenoylcysteine decarboxylase/phosphopantothenate--cysteine ligase
MADTSTLKGKRILLGVCGSIAAYKSLYLTRLLVKEGAEVKVIMTQAAETFVGPVSFSTLSKNPVFDHRVTDGSNWSNHVELGMWADHFLIAPASANTLAKMAGGLCDNLLLAVYLSAKCPVSVAPAMDLDMWKHPATKANIEKLQSHGNEIIPVGDGELASGLTGEGRMAEPDDILKFLKDKLA